VVSPQPDFAPCAHQADGGSAIERKALASSKAEAQPAGWLLVFVPATGAGVIVDGALEPERCRQSASKVFRTPKSDARTAGSRIRQLRLLANVPDPCASVASTTPNRRQGRLRGSQAGCGDRREKKCVFFHDDSIVFELLYAGTRAT
jgi:hypothetical protein